MNETITLPKIQFDIMKSRIVYLENVMRKIAEKVHLSQDEIALENPYKEGTDEWWSFEIAEGEADMLAGRGITLHNNAEIDRYFDTL